MNFNSPQLELSEQKREDEDGQEGRGVLPCRRKGTPHPPPSPGSSTHTNICPESKYGRKQIKCKLESDKNIGVSVTRGTKILYTRKMGKKCLKKKCPRPVSLTSITAPEMEGDIHFLPPGMGFLRSSTEGTAHGLGTVAVTWSCWLQRYTRVPAAVPKDRGMHPLSWKGQMGLGRPYSCSTHTLLWKKRFLHFLSKKYFVTKLRFMF